MTQLQHKHARAVRVFSLPLHAFGHLKAFARLYQEQVTLKGDGRTVTNSEALCNILQDHANMSLVATMNGLTIPELCSALLHRDLILTKPAA
ncbi:MAG: hypothetical protein HYX42_01605 [Polaromonas sp.]|uniref:hypothetical protein n=1 Tax=Polaromonas sp. TaxID=1869339 RepID=UPI0025D12870|nr:hypothetical protein [Polaromonas sp.]MBI2724923.1 hypothetical protein [Polaromonas sp.]